MWRSSVSAWLFWNEKNINNTYVNNKKSLQGPMQSKIMFNIELQKNERWTFSYCWQNLDIEYIRDIIMHNISDLCITSYLHLYSKNIYWDQVADIFIFQLCL